MSRIVSRRFVLAYVEFFLILIELVAAIVPASGSTVIFSDNFDTYNASPTPITNIKSPANAAQYAPPTPVWYAASGDDCTVGVNCETWGGVTTMGPNTIWAVTTEKSYSGKNSLELGMNDIPLDKTEAHIYLPEAQTPRTAGTASG